MHQNTMPTEDMSAKSHLRGDKFFGETYTTSELLLGPENDKFDLFPLCPFFKLHISNLLMSSMGGIDNIT